MWFALGCSLGPLLRITPHKSGYEEDAPCRCLIEGWLKYRALLYGVFCGSEKINKISRKKFDDGPKMFQHSPKIASR